MTSSNIWPEHLTLGRDERFPNELIDVAQAFVAANVAGDVDLVIQYAEDDGFFRPSIYHDTYGSWELFDIDNDEDEVPEFSISELGVLMLRDKMTHFIPLRIADGVTADRSVFEAAPYGSVASLADDGTVELYVRYNGSWHDGQGNPASTADLVRQATAPGVELSLVWTAPGEPLPIPVRTDYAPLDEVMYRGETAYVIQRSSEPERYVVNTGTLERIHYSNLTYVASPARPLSEADARARGISGSDIACRTCGDHGAAVLPDDDLFAAARLFIPADTAFCSAHRMHIAKASRAFVRDLQYQLNLDVDPTAPEFDELAAAAAL